MMSQCGITKETYAVGKTVEYGRFQGAPIRWRVLAEQGNMRLLFAETVLTELPYHHRYIDAFWQTCSLRKWLNQKFFMEAFSFEERMRIVNSRIENPANPRYCTNGGPRTVDKLFLLSLEEASALFAGDAQRCADHWWWLRSPGCNLLSAASVYTDGSLYDTGINLDYAEGGVRPAMWLLLRE